MKGKAKEILFGLVVVTVFMSWFIGAAYLMGSCSKEAHAQGPYKGNCVAFSQSLIRCIDDVLGVACYYPASGGTVNAVSCVKLPSLP
jgi:hypothetical protein